MLVGGLTLLSLLTTLAKCLDATVEHGTSGVSRGTYFTYNVVQDSG